MIEKTGAIDVYFEETIEILVDDAQPFSVAAAKEVLTENKVEFTSIEKSSI